MSLPASRTLILLFTCYLSQLFLVTPDLMAQKNRSYLASEEFEDGFRGDRRIRIISYNVENYFDYFDDSLKQDDEFLPFQGRFWTKEKFNKKTNQIAQVIIATGGWEAPGLVGLCEIENRYVLTSLTRFSLLMSANYEFIHKDSPDPRGIDVALLYRPEKFELIDYAFIKVSTSEESFQTRDILYAKGLLANQDTLHVFVNHWPSKYGGEFETEAKRIKAAQLLRLKMDSIINIDPQANIISMGDFNDTPTSKSSHSVVNNDDYTNLMEAHMYQYGTHSFENDWLMIDHIIVSNSLLSSTNQTQIIPNSVKIFNLPFLLTEGSLGNQRPFRTYQGPAYHGGFSDHLPIMVDLYLKR